MGDGDGRSPLGKDRVLALPRSVYIYILYLFVPVTCTDMFCHILLCICMFTDKGDLLPDNNEAYCLEDWNVVGAFPTPSDVFIYVYTYIDESSVYKSYTTMQ